VVCAPTEQGFIQTYANTGNVIETFTVDAARKTSSGTKSVAFDFGTVTLPPGHQVTKGYNFEKVGVTPGDTLVMLVRANGNPVEKTTVINSCVQVSPVTILAPVVKKPVPVAPAVTPKPVVTAPPTTVAPTTTTTAPAKVLDNQIKRPQIAATGLDVTPLSRFALSLIVGGAFLLVVRRLCFGPELSGHARLNN
jgi:hypothetical protein